MENPQASRDVSTGTQLVPSGNPIGIPPDYLYPNGTLQSNGKSHMPLIGIPAAAAAAAVGVPAAAAVAVAAAVAEGDS